MTALIELYANNAYSSLAATLSDSATSMTIDTGTGTRFPSPVVGDQFFRMTITSQNTPNVTIEIVYVTQVTGDTFTIERGQEGTTAQFWAIGDICGIEPTAGTAYQFLQPCEGVDTGTPDAYIVNTPQNENAYYTGMPVTFWTLNSNTTSSPTLDLNGLGATTIKNANGNPLASGQLPANSPISLLFNQSDTSWRLQSPVTSQSLTPNGYQIFPSGLILQWGSFLTDVIATKTVTFPIPFPNTIFQAYAAQGNANNTTWALGIPDVSAVQNSTFTNVDMTVFTLSWQPASKTWAPVAGLGIFWWAIGY